MDPAWERDHQVCFQMGEMTVCLDAEFPITAEAFHPKFERFRGQGPGEEPISFTRSCPVPEMDPGVDELGVSCSFLQFRKDRHETKTGIFSGGWMSTPAWRPGEDGALSLARGGAP